MPAEAASMPALSMSQPSTMTRLIISAGGRAVTRARVDEDGKVGAVVERLEDVVHRGAVERHRSRWATGRYFIPAASTAVRSASASAPPARLMTVLIPRRFSSGIAISRDVIVPPVDTVSFTRQKLLMPGTMTAESIGAEACRGHAAAQQKRNQRRARRYRLLHAAYLTQWMATTRDQGSGIRIRDRDQGQDPIPDP